MTRLVRAVALVLLAALMAGCMGEQSLEPRDDAAAEPRVPERCGNDPGLETYMEVELFAVTPPHEHPEGVAIRDGIVYVSTTAGLDAATEPSSGSPFPIYRFDLCTGEELGSMLVDSTGIGHAGLAWDAEGRLYSIDTGGSVLRIDVESGSVEVYATIANVPVCTPLITSQCSAALVDRPPLPNDLAFDAAGNLYVTDSFQAAIFRVAPGGGTGTVWFTDGRLDSALLGPNGIRVNPDETHILFGVTDDLNNDAVLFRIPLVDNPDPEQLGEVGRWPGGGQDGLTLGAEGLIYVSLYAHNEIRVLTENGTELAVITNDMFDEPATMAFDDANRALINPSHAFLNLDDTPRPINRVFVDDTAWPLLEPSIP
jgi:sugar lactone lactonase YvrE